MAKENNKHHDNRHHMWNISLNDSEYALAEANRLKSGLSKAKFGRDALMSSKVLSRLSPDDLEQVSRVSRIHAEINQIAAVLNTLGKSDSRKESLIEYMYKVREQIDHMEDSIIELDNYLRGKIG